jgi:hypothetical protein
MMLRLAAGNKGGVGVRFGPRRGHEPWVVSSWPSAISRNIGIGMITCVSGVTISIANIRSRIITGPLALREQSGSSCPRFSKS